MSSNLQKELFEKAIEIIPKNDCTFSNGFFQKNKRRNFISEDYKNLLSAKNIRSLSYKKIKVKHLKNFEKHDKLILKYINQFISNSQNNQKRNESADFVEKVPIRKQPKKNSYTENGKHIEPNALFGIKKLIINETMKNACYNDNPNSSKLRELSKENKETQETDYTCINETGTNIMSQTQKKSRNYISNKNNFKIIQNLISLNLKYKKMYENLVNDYDNLKEENIILKDKIEKLTDELEIRREEDKLNKISIKENEEKINHFSSLIKQQMNNFEQKIFNYKELLFKKDEEIQRLNKEIVKIDNNGKNNIEELKKKIKNYEMIIEKQNKVINNVKNETDNKHSSYNDTDKIINKNINNDDISKDINEGVKIININSNELRKYVNNF